jgi:hypothetical protein
VTVHATDRGGNQVAARRTLVLRLDRKWCAPTWQAVATSGVPDIAGVATVSAKNVWAVGSRGPYTAPTPVIAHWDGRKLSVVRGFPSTGRLSAVAAVSANDIWAVGGTVRGPPVALHWDGAHWHNVQTPALPASGRFAGVATLSRSDVWAVGQVGTQVLAEHWDGRTWRVLPIKQEGAFAAVDGDSSHDVWAVGAQGLTGPSVNDTGSLAMHWNGRRRGRAEPVRSRRRRLRERALGDAGERPGQS